MNIVEVAISAQCSLSRWPPTWKPTSLGVSLQLLQGYLGALDGKQLKLLAHGSLAFLGSPRAAALAESAKKLYGRGRKHLH